MRTCLALLCAALLAGCYDFGPMGGGVRILPPGGFAADEVTLAAGLAELPPQAQDTLSSDVDLTRFGITKFDRVYELETPVGEDFSFNVVARGRSNFGLTRLVVGHVKDGPDAPLTGAESIGAAGMTLEAPGMTNLGDVVNVDGDGFSRVTIRGRIDRSQVLLVKMPGWRLDLSIGIRISIGSPSEINLIGGNTQGPRPGVLWHDIYSSDSRQFGLPAIAVSGDRYSVVSYDGNRDLQEFAPRQRRWLQMDAATGAVTGGAAGSESPDSLFWRDQEIAALGNVLAVAYTGNGEVFTEISLDRGATFPIKRVLDSYSWGTRLVQTAIGPDYRMAVLYWRSKYISSVTRSQLVLHEAVPTSLDANNTPVGYSWQSATVVHTASTDVTPLMMHMEYSQGGDLVIGYGYTQVTFESWSVVSRARYMLATRMWGAGTFTDVELDNEQHVMPCDPHVCLLGSGNTMEIFYAYERADGVHLLYSNDAGASFTPAAAVPLPGAMMPSVHARIVNGEKRVDVLYIAPAGWGLELHNLRWADFSLAAAPEVFQLTQSSAVPGGSAPPGASPGYLITTLAWFGYDAVIMDDQLAVVTHELTYDSYEYYWTMGWDWNQPVGGPIAASGGAGGGGGMAAPSPPVLLPGMTDPVPQPNPTHRNQLRVAVLS